MVSFNILGDCVSRDILQPLVDKQEVCVLQYSSFSSPMSMCSCPPNGITVTIEDLVNNTGSDFEHRCFMQDVNKQTLDYVFAKNSDFIIVDILDARAPLLHKDSTYITVLNQVVRNRQYLNQRFGFDSYTEVSPFGISIEKWEECINTICKRLSEHYSPSQIIINKHFGAECFYEDGLLKNYSVGYMEQIKRYNPLVEKLFSLIETKLPGCHIIEFPKGIVGDGKHKWGLYPLHYHSGYYEYGVEAIKTIIKGLPPEQERQRLNNLKIECENKQKSLIPNAFNEKIIEKYTENFICNLNDILSIYVKRNSFRNKSILKKSAENICSQKDNPLIKISEEYFRKNVECLTQYEYCDSSYLPDSMPNKIYMQIQDKFWLIIDSSSEEPFAVVTGLIRSDFDYKSVINNNYVCSVKYADALTYSYEYYIEKARKGDGDKPTYLSFKDRNEFIESLYYMDYTELLDNEKFVFVFSGKRPDIPQNYVPVVNLTQLLDPYVVTVCISCGLGDQLCHYILGQVIEKFENREVIYDDTSIIGFNGFEVYKFAKQPMNLLSDILSVRLNQRNIFQKLYKKIYEKYIYVTCDYSWYPNNAAGSPCILIGNNYSVYNLPYLYYNTLIRVETLMQHYDFLIGDFIEFPPLERLEHIKLSEEMLSCDAIVMHIRRGDYVSLGWDADTEFYKEAMSKVLTISDYKNKKVFVFSDDIKWCKENKSDLGLCDIDNVPVVFVEGNKNEESFRDIQLMSFGKIMICGTSYFPKIATLYGTRWEEIASANSSGFEGKYNLGKFSKNYRKNVQSRKPK